MFLVGFWFSFIGLDTVSENHLEDSHEKIQMSETIEKLSAHLAAVNKNLEVQVADNSQLSRLFFNPQFHTVI